ncbi:MAG: response regulator [Candidatus Aenigmatarchaeota archaeon]
MARKVAIIDDDKDVAECIGDVLREKGCGCAIGVFRNGAAFIAACEKEQYRLVLTDYDMGGMTGAELIEAHRARWSGSAYIIMSGKEENRRHADTLGVPFLQKPVPIEEIYRYVCADCANNRR